MTEKKRGERKGETEGEKGLSVERLELSGRGEREKADWEYRGQNEERENEDVWL